MNAGNLYSREVPLGPAHLPVATAFNDPVQARAMDKQDIRNLRRWHRNAALRAKKAGYDIAYVYAGKLFGGAMYFISRRYNERTDEYGGSLENRSRLLRELIEDTKEAVGDSMGVVCRISVDELLGEDGLHAAEARDMVAMMAELPDCWDLTLSGWENDSPTSRFSEEAYQEPFVTGLKQLTTKPVVGVGRFTSPDTMVRMVKKRHSRSDRRGAAFDRRSVSSEEDRRRPHRRHPRMHRLQHVRRRRFHHDAQPLHAEPVLFGRMAQRLASRTYPSAPYGCACSGCRSGPAGLEASMMLGGAAIM